MNILGLNAFHGDSSACIIKEGKLVAAIEEERITRVKHSAGFPINAINQCLKIANLNFEDIDFIAQNRNPNERLLEKALFTLKKRPSFDLIQSRLKNLLKVKGGKNHFASLMGIDPERDPRTHAWAWDDVGLDPQSTLP